MKIFIKFKRLEKTDLDIYFIIKSYVERRKHTQKGERQSSNIPKEIVRLGFANSFIG